jgi:hypothetical protein
MTPDQLARSCWNQSACGGSILGAASLTRTGTRVRTAPEERSETGHELRSTYQEPGRDMRTGECLAGHGIRERVGPEQPGEPITASSSRMTRWRRDAARCGSRLQSCTRLNRVASPHQRHGPDADRPSRGSAVRVWRLAISLRLLARVLAGPPSDVPARFGPSGGSVGDRRDWDDERTES